MTEKWRTKHVRGWAVYLVTWAWGAVAGAWWMDGGEGWKAAGTLFAPFVFIWALQGRSSSTVPSRPTAPPGYATEISLWTKTKAEEAITGFQIPPRHREVLLSQIELVLAETGAKVANDILSKART